MLFGLPRIYGLLIDAVDFTGIAAHDILRLTAAGGASAGAAVKAGQIGLYFVNARQHLKGSGKVGVQLQYGVGRDIAVKGNIDAFGRYPGAILITVLL